MKLRLNKILFLLLSITVLYGKNIKYANFDIHTLTIPKDGLLVNTGYLISNDNIDIFHLRDSSLGNSVSNLNGFEFEALYGISDNMMMGYRVAREELGYNSYTLTNTKNDIFFRYHLFDNKLAKFNSGVSIDIGFVNNTMDDLYLTNISDINSMAKRYFPGKNIYIKQEDDGRLKLYKGNQYSNLKYYPWIGLENTNDNSFYLRAISGFYKKDNYIDFFVGAKRTHIKSQLVANQELTHLASLNGYTLQKNLDRYENMFFGGISVACEIKNFILEGKYEYDLFQRESNLGYINSNHIIDLSLDYKLTKHLLVYTSAKVMLNQLNGQIPYLYNQYTQTTFDHKYGYAKFGFVYYFK